MTYSRFNFAGANVSAVDKMESNSEIPSVSVNEALKAFNGVAFHLGLGTKDIALLHVLVAESDLLDWQSGKRPVVWMSDIELEKVTKLSSQALTQHIANLVGAGLIHFERTPASQLRSLLGAQSISDVARGFDLSPLALRTGEFEWLAEAQDYERWVANQDRDESFNHIGSIFATLHTVASSAKNRVLCALKTRFQTLFAPLPFHDSDASPLSKGAGFLQDRWSAVGSSNGDGSSNEIDVMADEAPVNGEQPSLEAGFAQIVDDIISDHQLLGSQPESLYGRHYNANMQQPDVGFQDNLELSDKSYYAESDAESLINLAQNSKGAKVSKPTPTPIGIVWTKQSSAYYQKQLNGATALMSAY